MRPHGRFLRPHALLILLFERIRHSAQDRVVVGALVLADASPVDGFGRGGTIGIALYDVSITLLRVGPALRHEGYSRQPHLKLCAKLFLWQIALYAPTLFAVRIHNQNRRRPHCVEAMKVDRVLFDVRLQGQKILVDEA